MSYSAHKYDNPLPTPHASRWPLFTWSRIEKLFSGPFRAVALLGTQAVLLFVTNLYVARILGASEFGVYSLAYATLMLLTVLGTLGGRGTIIRNISRYITIHDNNRLKGLLIYCNLVGLGTSMVILGLGTLVANLCLRYYDHNLVNSMQIMLLFLPFSTLLLIRQFVARGFKLIFGALAPESIIRPALFLILVYWLSKQRTIHATDVLWILGFSTVFSCLVGYLLTYRPIADLIRGHKPMFEWAEWIRSSLMVIVSSFGQTLSQRLDLYIIALFLPMSQVGYYSVARKITMTLGIIDNGVRVWAAPHVSSLNAREKMVPLQAFLKRVIRFTSGAVAILVMIIVIFAKPILGLFGQEYTNAASVLIVLVLAEMIHIAFGMGGTVMLMTSQERPFMFITLGNALFSALVMLLLVPYFGLMGAAIGFLLSVILLNTCYNVSVYRAHKLKCHLH